MSSLATPARRLLKMNIVKITGLLLLTVLIGSCYSDHIENIFGKHLTSVPKDLGRDVTHLLLGQNDIAEIKNLERYPKLVYLMLHDNHFTTNEDIRGVCRAPNLQFLDISHSHLQTLNMQTFRKNTKLEIVILDNNKFSVSGNIPNLPYLTKLSLQNCGLHEIPWKDFKPVPKLKVLVLLGNPIKDIPEETLRTLANGVKLEVDDELCLVLAKKSIIKEKRIELACNIPTDIIVTENEPKVEAATSAKIPIAVIVLLVVLVVAVLLSLGLVICWKIKKSKVTPQNEADAADPFMLYFKFKY